MRCSARGGELPDENVSGAAPEDLAHASVGSPRGGAAEVASLWASVVCRAAPLLAVLAAAAVLLPHLGSMPLWGSEGRWALIARAMWRSGDLFSPTMGAHPYWDKPLLSYWQILPFATMAGRVDELAIRLPSVVWAVVLILLTFDLAARWSDRATALLASLVLASSLGFVFWGRNAQVEMSNAAVILLVLWIFVRHRRDAGTGWVYAVAVVAGLGANLKGLTAYGVPAFCVLLVAVVERDWSWLPGWRTVLAAALVSLSVFVSLPLLQSLVLRTWEPFTVAWRENVLRYFAPFDHEDPVWTYLVRVFDLFAPWSLLLPIALARTMPALWRRTLPASEALLCALATFAFFTLAGSRRPYYLLPILPFLACLVAEVVRDWASGRLTPRQDRWVCGVFVVLGGALIAALVVYVAVLPFAGRLPVDPTGLGWAALGSALTGAAVVWSVRRGSAWTLAGAVAGVWLVYTACVVPFAAAHPGLRDEAARLRDLHRPCGLLATEDTDLQFYLDAPCADLADEAAALRWAHASGGFVVTALPLAEPAWHEALRTKSWRAVVAAADAPSSAPAP